MSGRNSGKRFSSMLRNVRSGMSVRRPRIRRESFRRPTGRKVLALLLVLGAAGGIITGLSRATVDTSTDSFLPSGDPTLQAVDQQARSFGGDPVVVLLKSKQPRQLVLDNKQLFPMLGLEGKLAKTPNVASVYGPATVLNQVAGSAQNLLAQIGGRRDTIRREAEDNARKQGQTDSGATAAGNDAVSQFDVRYGSLLVRGLPAGMPTLHNPQFVRTVVFDSNTGEVRPQWKFVVPSPDTVAISVRPREGLDQVGTQRLVSDIKRAVHGSGLAVSGVTVSGVPAVTAGLADEVVDELPWIAGLVAVAVALRFLLVPMGFRMRHRLLPLVAALVGTAATVAGFGLLGHPLSFGAVAFLPVLIGVGSSIPLYLAVLRDTRRVVTISIASAAGFASLAVSPLPFVRELGIALAGGILLTVASTLVLRRGLPDHERPDVTPQTTSDAGPSKPLARRSRRVAVAVSVAIIALGGWVILPQLTIQADPQQLARGLPELQNAQQAQQVLGSSGEVSVALKGGPATSPAALAWSRQTEQTIIAKYGDQLRPILTLPDLVKFLGPEPTDTQIQSAIELLPRYLTSAVLSPDSRDSSMIFGLQLQDIGHQAQLLNEVRQSLPPPPPGYTADFVGLPVAAERGYDLISQGRYLANLTGIVAAGAVLLIGLRRRGDAIRAVLAAILATGWSLAGLWLVGGSLSPLTVAMGSLTTVTGCEFLVLLADPQVEANQKLRRSVGFACLTSAVGYCALAVSDLSVLREFGLVLTGTVVMSYVAARTVLWIAPHRPSPDNSHTSRKTTSHSEIETLPAEPVSSGQRQR